MPKSTKEVKLHKLPASKTSKKRRYGRGNSGHRGTTSGRGTKGQKARSGKTLKRGFEGGQTPLYRRIPKRKGFTSRKSNSSLITLSDLERIGRTTTTITPKVLVENSLIKYPTQSVKLVAQGEITKKVMVVNIPGTKQAQQKVEKAGGGFKKDQEESKKENVK